MKAGMKLRRLLLSRGGILVAVLLIAVAYSYRRWIRPIEVSRADLSQRSEDVGERIRRAENEMKRIKERQQHGSAIRQTLTALHKNLPEDPAIIWFPSRVKMMFSQLGVSEVNVRLNKTVPERLLLGFERNYWLLSVPPQGDARKMTDILQAVAQIEQQDSFVQIEGLSFHLETAEAGGITGYVNLSAFVPK